MLKIGDKVLLTHSNTNWSCDMDRFVGRIVTITRIEILSAGTHRIVFNPIVIDGVSTDYFVWQLEDGHFKPINGGYMGPVFSQSFLQFLTSIEKESRVAKLIMTCRNMSIDGLGSIINHVLTDEFVNYITYRQDGNISYLPKGKPHLTNEDSSWKREGRQDGKPSKVIRKIFKPNVLKILKEADFEVFNNKYKARFSMTDFKFKELPANRVSEVYCMDIYDPQGGCSLQSSCMNGDAGYLEIYDNAGESLRIITPMSPDGLLAGRALLWKAKVVGAVVENDVVAKGDEIDLMDRIYVSKDSFYESFIEYAQSKG